MDGFSIYGIIVLYLWMLSSWWFIACCYQEIKQINHKIGLVLDELRQKRREESEEKAKR